MSKPSIQLAAAPADKRRHTGVDAIVWDRIALAALLALLVYAGTVHAYRSWRMAFWFDEVATVIVTSQGSVHGIWRALEHGVDMQPPLFFTIELLPRALFRDPHLAYRVPSILGFLVVPAALFFFVKQRCGLAPALIAAVFPFLTKVHLVYATEARPYTLVLACTALALLLWQSADQPGRLALLAFVLATAMSLHYYAAFGVVPLVVGEAVRTVRLRKVRGLVWAAFVCACIPLPVFLPLASQARQFYGTHFWARPGVLSFAGAYDALVPLNAGWGAGLALALALGMAIMAVRPSVDSWRKTASVPLEEVVAVVALIGIPLLAYTAASIAHTGMTARYTLPCVLGISIAIAYLASAGGPAVARGTLALLVSMVMFQEAHFWMSHRAEPTASSQTYAELRILEGLKRAAGVEDLPVVVCNGIEYLPMAYYSGAKTDKLLALIDYENALAFTGSDSVDRALTALAQYIPLNVEQFSTVVSEKRKLLLYSIGDQRFDWLPAGLRKNGYVVSPIATEKGRTLYRAEMRQESLQ